MRISEWSSDWCYSDLKIQSDRLTSASPRLAVAALIPIQGHQGQISMFQTIAKSRFGSSNDRYVKTIGKIVNQINALEPQIQALSDDELKAQTDRKSVV